MEFEPFQAPGVASLLLGVVKTPNVLAWFLRPGTKLFLGSHSAPGKCSQRGDINSILMSLLFQQRRVVKINYNYDAINDLITIVITNPWGKYKSTPQGRKKVFSSNASIFSPVSWKIQAYCHLLVRVKNNLVLWVVALWLNLVTL